LNIAIQYSKRKAWQKLNLNKPMSQNYNINDTHCGHLENE